MSFIVSTLAVTSSPVTPSPRVAARTRRPRSYSRATARPSILSSHRKLAPVPPSRSMRAAQAESSSLEKALSRLCMRSRCSTGEKVAAKPPLTFWLGDSGVTRAGCAASIALSSPISSSY